MRRRPGMAALENVVRGITGQPRLAPARPAVPPAIPDEGIVVSRAILSATETLVDAGTVSGRAALSGSRKIVEKSGGASAKLSGGGKVHHVHRSAHLNLGANMEHEFIPGTTIRRPRPEKVTEVGFIIGVSGFSGWLGEQATGTADGALGLAAVGCVVAYVLWTRWAEPPGF